MADCAFRISKQTLLKAELLKDHSKCFVKENYSSKHFVVSPVWRLKDQETVWRVSAQRMSCFLNWTYKTKLLITGQGLKRLGQLTNYIIRIHVAERCRKLWIAKLFADGKAVSEYTNHDNENCIIKLNFKGKVQERTIKDYIKKLPKCLPVIFLFQEQRKFLKHHVTWQKFPLTHCRGNICERHRRNHINAHFTESFLSESSFLVSSIPNVCIQGHMLCPMVSAQLMGAGAVVAGQTLQH